MEMSLNRIADLLRANELSHTAFLWSTPDGQQTLLIPLESKRQLYLLELRQDGGERSWRISEVGN